MRAVFFDGRGALRNGWWILVFLACVLATRFAHSALLGLLKQWQVAAAWRDPLPVLFALLATWAVCRLRRERLADVGLRMDGRWAKQFAIGSAGGAAMLLAVAAMMAAAGAVRFELDPVHSWAGLALGLHAFLWAALLEELLFRGFVFQRLVAGIGAWPAQLAMAALFAAGHWNNPGMDGLARAIGALDVALAAVMLGLAYLRTRSLALPLGLHLGWNWMQGSVLGFNVSGYDQVGWWRPVIHGDAAWLTGAGVGAEGTVFSLGVSLVVIAVLWRWPGDTAGRRAQQWSDGPAARAVSAGASP